MMRTGETILLAALLLAPGLASAQTAPDSAAPSAPASPPRRTATVRLGTVVGSDPIVAPSSGQTGYLYHVRLDPRFGQGVVSVSESGEKPRQIGSTVAVIDRQGALSLAPNHGPIIVVGPGSSPGATGTPQRFFNNPPPVGLAHSH